MSIRLANSGHVVAYAATCDVTQPGRHTRVFEITLALVWLLGAANAYFLLTYTAFQSSSGYASGFDGNSYFAMVRSLAFDGDLNCRNEFAFIVATQPRYVVDAFLPYFVGKEQKPVNVFPVGTSLATLPALLLARGAVGLAELASGRVFSGFSAIYVLAYYWASLTYAVGALWVCFRVLLRWFSRPVAAAACWASLLCGSFIYYTLYEHSMSHGVSAFFGACAVFAWAKAREAEGRRAWMLTLLCGLSVGFAVAVRPYNAPFGLLLLTPVWGMVRRTGQGESAIAGGECKTEEGETEASLCGPERGRAAKEIVLLVIGIIGGLLGFASQLIAWRLQHGAWIANPDAHEFTILPRYALNVLFARRHGLFFWSPLYLASLVGLVLAWRAWPRPGRVLLLVLAGMIWMYGNWREWWLGVAFGMRGLGDAVVIWGFGFAAVIEIARRKWQSALVRAWIVIAIFGALNLHLLMAFRSGSVLVDGPLYWTESVRHPHFYWRRAINDWLAWTDHNPKTRAPLLSPPYEGHE